MDTTIDYTATYILTTDCTCEYYDENDELVPSDDCLGCYEDELFDLREKLDMWIEYHDASYVRVDASGLGWMKRSGYTVTTATAKHVIDMLTLNGDYRAEFYFDAENNLTARRWSHDEPVGTGLFTFTPAELAEEE